MALYTHHFPAGDGFGSARAFQYVAALALAEEKGLPLEEAVVLSTATGAANVMCSGTQAAEYSVIASLMPKVIWHEL